MKMKVSVSDPAMIVDITGYMIGEKSLNTTAFFLRRRRSSYLIGDLRLHNIILCFFVQLINLLHMHQLKLVKDLAEGVKPIKAMLTASQEIGIFQVINHGVPEKTMIDAMSVLKEFFDMPSKEATGYVPHKKGWIYTNADHTKDGVYLWRENLKHICHPLEDCIHLWPDKPARYQEIIAAYLVEIQKLSLVILEMICEGLGLEPGYLNDMSEVQLFSSNFYPPCPDPSLTLGILAHQDPSLITFVYQGSSTGLQILKDGQWINVAAVPNSFIVNIGNQLEIISNGKLRSIDHRVVNSTDEARTSIATFVNPSYNCIIEPAKVLINEVEPSRYKAIRYKEYVDHNNAFGDYTAALQNIVISES